MKNNKTIFKQQDITIIEDYSNEILLKPELFVEDFHINEYFSMIKSKMNEANLYMILSHSEKLNLLEIKKKKDKIEIKISNGNVYLFDFSVILQDEEYENFIKKFRENKVNTTIENNQIIFEYTKYDFNFIFGCCILNDVFNLEISTIISKGVLISGNIIEFNVEYIGISDDILKRLSRHEKRIQINSQNKFLGNDKNLFILGIDYKKNTSKNILNSSDLKLNRQDLELVEHLLIYYFKPEYNIAKKNLLPQSNDVIWSELTLSSINSIIKTKESFSHQDRIIYFKNGKINSHDTTQFIDFYSILKNID